MKAVTVPEYLEPEQGRLDLPQDLNNFTFAEQQHQEHNPQQHHQQPNIPSHHLDKAQNFSSEPVQPTPEDSSNSHREGQHEIEEFEIADQFKQSNSLEGSPQNEEKTNQQIISEDEEREGHGYEELTMKLESALNKIAGAKGLSKKGSQSNTIWGRAEECAARMKKDLLRKTEQSEQMRKQEVRAKPTINKHSERLAKDVGYQPIYSRYEKLMEVKKKRDKEIEDNKKLQREEEEALFQEELNQYMRKPENVRSYDEYFDQMVKWRERSNKEIREKQELQKSKQLEGVTFKPILNNKSKKLVSSQTRLPIDQRGLVKQKVKPECSFKPNTSRKVVK